ncbi:palmitoyltransferase ZDHHC16A isoform X1 [Notothenia coriiceps]|uniref:Palmitoyltransferase n=1 Tax=Notothenia coriiceps TaxID=8208 RepID=A0A6I9P2F0_9TELE|nr:PREDICTED: probable palmitoyltransferase ZDHHC16 isoform X1 [Notothenia coriiceps]XP_010780706.1 PREDICTED: probable palmitoyltransferase ZDHHC16 isoform X1 [Notothenia coriiceps]
MRWCPSSSFHLLRCVRLRTCTKRRRNTLPLWIREIWAYIRLLVQSFYFNSLTDSDVVFDSVFEPVFWTVDYITRWFGTVFVFLVVFLTSSILAIAYLFVLPMVFRTYSTAWITWHVCYGHWNLVMIVFNYYKATMTSPGYPPTVKNDRPFVSVCKKCIIPKPARTHHCGICNRCILRMDHHCPWLNNCVGHLNHRYFFNFCLFMTMGCVFCSFSGRNLFLDAYNAIERFKHTDVEKPGVPVTGMGVLIGLLPPGQTNYQTAAPPYTFKDKMINKSIIYMWVLTSTVAVALGALTCWHAVLISRGETSIERHLNHREKERMEKRGRVYKNPFDYGRLNNWKVFFGVQKRSHWLTRVLLPSGHTPPGDGLTWEAFPVKKDVIPV